MVTRKPVRIVAVASRFDRHLVGREATAYSGSSPLLNRLYRLSAEASATHRSGYVGIDEVTVESITTTTESVML